MMPDNTRYTTDDRFFKADSSICCVNLEKEGETAMKLQIESIDIKEVQIASKTEVRDNLLYLNPLEIETLVLKDPRIASVEIKVAHPGDPVRIVNIVDIIQPRCKIDRENEDFPGWLGRLAIAGRGKTRSLRGVSVMLSNSMSKRPYSSLVDMFGKAAGTTPYGSLKNISLHPQPSAGVDERDFESAVKLAGLKTAVFLARAAQGHPIDETEVYELDIPNLNSELKTGPGAKLPRIAYYHMLHTPQHDYQGIGDPIFYGAPVTDLLPTIIHPNEILDGGIINTHTMRGMDTYTLQNNTFIKELYRRHRKEIIFCGVVAGVASVEPVQRQRTAMMVGHLIADMLGADGAIMNKIHGGMPHVDLGLAAEACENLGVKTTVLINAYQTIGALNDAMLFSAESLDAIVNCGSCTEKIYLPQATEIFGGTLETPVFNPKTKQKAGDAMLEVEQLLFAGMHAHAGGSTIRAAQY